MEAVILEEFRQRVIPAVREGLVIRPGRYGPDAPLFGAAEVAFESLIADPTTVRPVALRRYVRRRAVSRRSAGLSHSRKTSRAAKRRRLTSSVESS